MATTNSQPIVVPVPDEDPTNGMGALAAWHEHDCPGCGTIVSPLQEAMGEGMLALLRDAGPCTPLYCQTRLLEILLDA